jgi:hypothetical protein
MNYDQESYDAELQRRIEAYGVKVRSTTNRELMSIFEKIYNDPDNQDAALVVASYNEVRRRYVTAGWFWKRWLNKQQYEQWNNFIALTEAKATKFVFEKIQNESNCLVS